MGGLVASRPICFRDVEKRRFLSDGSLLRSGQRLEHARVNVHASTFLDRAYECALRNTCAAEEQRGFCDKDVSRAIDRPSNERILPRQTVGREREKEREWNSFYKRIPAATDSRKYLQKAFANVFRGTFANFICTGNVTRLS